LPKPKVGHTYHYIPNLLIMTSSVNLQTLLPNFHPVSCFQYLNIYKASLSIFSWPTSN